MNLKNLSSCLTVLLLLGFSMPGSSSPQYGTYVNNNYNYEIIIPATWPREELTLSNKHFMYASKDANTEIKVRAFKTSDEDIDKQAHSETWDLRKIDPKLQKIIETGEVKIQKNIIGKLLIFEYRSAKNNFLQRTLITKNNGIIYIIECKSPQYSFYKYEDIFTTAFASFKYRQGSSQEQGGELKSETPDKKDNLNETQPKDKSQNPNTDNLEEEENP